MTTATCRQPLPDVQSTVDTRKIAIDRVGVKGITLPMTVKSVAGSAHRRHRQYVRGASRRA